MHQVNNYFVVISVPLSVLEYPHITSTPNVHDSIVKCIRGLSHSPWPSGHSGVHPVQQMCSGESPIAMGPALAERASSLGWNDQQLTPIYPDWICDTECLDVQSGGYCYRDYCRLP